MSLLLVLPGTAGACTPVIPLTSVFFGGPTVVALQYGSAALLLVVALKCMLYARLADSGSRIASVCGMFLANIVSSVAGIFLLMPFAVPATPELLLLPLLLCFWASGVLARVTEEGAPIAPPRWAWFLLLVGSFVGCFAAYFYSQSLLSGAAPTSLARYWFAKWSALSLTVVFSLCLTCAFEVAVLTGKRLDAKTLHGRARAVLLANLGTFLFICAVGAAIVLPHRLRSPTGLVGESVLR